MTQQNESNNVAQADSTSTPAASQSPVQKKSKLALIIVVLLALVFVAVLLASITAVLQSRAVSELLLLASGVVIVAFIVGRLEGAARPKQIASKALKAITRGLFGIVNLSLLTLTASIAIIGLKQQDSAALTPVFTISADQQNSNSLYQQACTWLAQVPNSTCQSTEVSVLETLQPLPETETPVDTAPTTVEPSNSEELPASVAVEVPLTAEPTTTEADNSTEVAPISTVPETTPEATPAATPAATPSSLSTDSPLEVLPTELAPLTATQAPETTPEASEQPANSAP